MSDTVYNTETVSLRVLYCTYSYEYCDIDRIVATVLVQACNRYVLVTEYRTGTVCGLEFYVLSVPAGTVQVEVHGPAGLKRRYSVRSM